ncbi:MAG: DUF3820 family protein [Luteolibacter sp.]|uniref:putative quorum-sensing-regulated virulence factor n=1 Tax=Luteolibacter sp. TaxID=1962973 RepID=UPI003262E4D2
MARLTDNDPMPFGKHKGKRMEDVPANYLLWLHSEGCSNPDVAAYIEESMAALTLESPDTLVRKPK